jgi:predicted ferric reductase
MLKNYKFGLALFWLSVLFLLPLPLIQLAAIELPELFQTSLQPIQFGVIAYTWMQTSLFLASKPRWLDRLVGLPAIYLLHGILSILAIGLAFLHKSQMFSVDLIELTGSWAFNIFLGVALYSLIFMAGFLTSRLAFLATIKHYLEKIFKHELSLWLHRLNLVATALITLHVFLISYIRSMTGFMIVFVGYTLIGFGSYLFSLYRDRLHPAKGQVTNLHFLNANTVELTLTLTKPNDLHCSPGDYLFIRFPKVRGLKEPHPFSLVNRPRPNGELVFAIRGDGDFTKKLQQVTTKENVAVFGSFGRFQAFIDEHPAVPIVAITGGIGVVPILSLIESNQTRATTVFFSAKTEQELLYTDKFATWHNRPNFQSFIQTGRFSEQFLTEHLQTADLKNAIFLLSGPPNLGRSWQKILKKQGIKSWQMYYEEFAW